MSKIKKKPIDRTSTISEKDIKLIKIIQFSGWFFLLALAALGGAWLFLDYLLNVKWLDLELKAPTYTYIVYTGTNAALSFGAASYLNKNKERKREIFFDWLTAQFLFSMFAIFALAAYQW
ncbi:MAG: hypothetical protein ACTSQJ_03870 [Promethearchaeota archaeon]